MQAVIAFALEHPHLFNRWKHKITTWQLKFFNCMEILHIGFTINQCKPLHKVTRETSRPVVCIIVIWANVPHRCITCTKALYISVAQSPVCVCLDNSGLFRKFDLYIARWVLTMPHKCVGGNIGFITEALIGEFVTVYFYVSILVSLRYQPQAYHVLTENTLKRLVCFYHHGRLRWLRILLSR